MLYSPAQREIGYGFITRHHDTYPEIDPRTKSDCSGKAVVITGASRGIGMATAVSYALAGVSHLAITGRSDLSKAQSLIEAKCAEAGKPVPKILALTMDTTDNESVQAAAKAVETEFGKLDILYNNAGAADKLANVMESDPLEWWNLHETNVKGVYLSTRAFLPLMLRGGDKTIVNTASIGAHMTLPGASAYQISKLAVTRFSEFLMAEYGEQGVLSFSIHPGGVKTSIADHLPEWFVSNLIDTPELPADALVHLTHVKRDWLAGRYIDLCWDVPELLAKEKEIVEGDKLKIQLIV